MRFDLIWMKSNATHIDFKSQKLYLLDLWLINMIEYIGYRLQNLQGCVCVRDQYKINFCILKWIRLFFRWIFRLQFTPIQNRRQKPQTRYTPCIYRIYVVFIIGKQVNYRTDS